MPRSRIRKEALNPQFNAWLKSTNPGTIIWDMQENDGASAAIASNHNVTGVTDSALFPTSTNLLVDGDMENAGVGDWIANSGATLTKETAAPYEGLQNLKVQSTGGDNGSQARQDILTSGTRYVVDGRYRTDTGGTVQLTIGLTTQVNLSDVSDWTAIDVERLADNIFLMLGTIGVNKFAEFDGMRVRVANPLNATINSTTVAQPFGGNIPYAYLYDGNNDNLAIGGTALAAGFSLAKCELLIFGKITTATATVRNLFRVTAGTDLCEIRNSASGELTWRFKVGAVDEEIVVGSLATDEFFMASILCEDGDNGDFVTARFNGVQVGTSTGAGFGTVAAVTAYTVGSAGAAQYWDGLLTENILVPSGQFSATEELEILQRSGI